MTGGPPPSVSSSELEGIAEVGEVEPRGQIVPPDLLAPLHPVAADLQLAATAGSPENELWHTLPTDRPGRAPPFANLLAEAASAQPGPEARRDQDTLKIGGRASRVETMPSVPRSGVEPNPRIGRTLGAYRILGELGAGGMAVVYKALQPSVDRLVAVKELRPEYLHDKQIAARFEREATSLAALQHGNIVHIYDYIREFDAAYIVMEHVEGIDLFDLLAAVQRLPADVGAVLGLQLAEGLEYAHYRGIIHRDVKPSNVLVSKMGELKIMDFGIARDPGRVDLTQVGMALGTPAYMAPEQIAGGKIDFRADIFAFGIVLYEMLTGHKPWGDEDGRAITRKVLYEEFTPPTDYVPDLPLELVEIIATCLSKDPAKRFPTTHALRRALEAYVGQAVRIDPRQRVVVFLRNRGLITQGDASSVVAPGSLDDGTLKLRDLGLPSPGAHALLRPLVAAAVAGMVGIVLGLVLSTLLPYGRRLPPERPRLAPIPRSADLSLRGGPASPDLRRAP